MGLAFNRRSEIQNFEYTYAIDFGWNCHILYAYKFSVGSVGPAAGEVVFIEEEGDAPAAMVWQYREPREVRWVHAAPVPLSITRQEDQPVDMKVSLTEVWHKSVLSWQPLHCYPAMQMRY